MTNKDFIMKLEVISDMGDTQITALADVLIEYLREEKQPIGFKKDKK